MPQLLPAVMVVAATLHNHDRPSQPCAPAAGLGELRVLSDELILHVLNYLPAADLSRMGLGSKALYCFCHNEELWKAFVHEVSAWHAYC